MILKQYTTPGIISAILSDHFKITFHWLHTPVVYEIPCSCGSVYVGDTKRRINEIKEHIRHTKNEDFAKSVEAEHSKITNHEMLFEETRVLANTPLYHPRTIRGLDTIGIYEGTANFNKDDSFKIPRAWGIVLQQLKENCSASNRLVRT